VDVRWEQTGRQITETCYERRGGFQSVDFMVIFSWWWLWWVYGKKKRGLWWLIIR
jgi:hypothetical protein